MPKRQTSIFEYREARLVRLKTGFIDLTQDDAVVKAESGGVDIMNQEPDVMEEEGLFVNETEERLMKPKIDTLADGLESECQDGGQFSNSVTSPTFIPLNPDISKEPLVKQELPESTFQTNEPVPCPVCNRDLGYLELNTRVQHVEMCLVAPKKEPKKEGTKKPSLPADPRTRYKNTIIKTLDAPKIIKHPTAHGERTRPPIPQLKLMDFPVTANTSYKVSVDAFSFAPHEQISQYFLTHFHSDHYGGITKKWSYYRVFLCLEEYEDDSKYRPIIYATKVTSRLLTLRFGIDPRFIKDLDFDTRYCIKTFENGNPADVAKGGHESSELDPGLYVTPITANHCPGAAIFLFESVAVDHSIYRILHCGDFRVNNTILQHPLIKPFHALGGTLLLDKVYLDTTYMDPKYNFPKQESVCNTTADMFRKLVYTKGHETKSISNWLGILKQSRITDFMKAPTTKKKYLILVGTYLIGKENLAIAILKKLNDCPIYVLCINSRNDKLDIVRTYENEHLDKYVSRDDLGNDTCDCVVHLVPMNIVGSKGEIANYFNLNRYYEKFEQCVGIRPTGWSFKEKKVDAAGNEDVIEDYGDFETTINLPRAHAINTFADIMLEQPPYEFTDISPCKSQSNLYNIYSLPYSEHSSFRELSYFGIFLNIGTIIPTVNTHNEWSIKKMDDIIRHWEDVRKFKRREAVDMNFGASLIAKLEALDLSHF